MYNQFISIQDIINDTTPAPVDIIGGGIMPKNSLLLISGKQKTRKSYLAMNFAISLANGKSFACFNIKKPVRVLSLSAEGGYYSNRQRLKDMCRTNPVTAATYLHLCFDTRFKLEDEKDVESIRTLIAQHNPEVMIFDPFIRYHGVDENSAGEMAKIFKVLRALIEDFNLSIILIHHSGKNSANGARGSSVILGEHDTHIMIEQGKVLQTLRFELRHNEAPNAYVLKFNKETSWFGPAVDVPTGNKYDTVFGVSVGLSKKDLVDRLITSSSLSQSTAYRLVDKAVAIGDLEFDGSQYSPSRAAVKSPRLDRKVQAIPPACE